MQVNANVNVTGYHINEEGIFNSNGKHIKEDGFNFLLTDSPDSIKIFSNLDACVAALFRLYPQKKQFYDYLLTSTKKMSRMFKEELGIQYFPGKSFSIVKGWYPNKEAVAQFSDANQYSEDLSRAIIRDDGFTCAKKAQEVGAHAIEIFTRLGYEPVSATSPVSVFRRAVLRKINLPSMGDIPSDVRGIDFQTCKGGWFEAFKTGYFPHVYDYDINSSYPFNALNLWDIRDGEWIGTKSLVGLDEMTYGALDVVVDIKSDFSPVILQRHASELERNYTPKDKFPTQINLQMAKYILESGIGDIEVNRAFYFKRSKGCKVLPFQEIVEQLYKTRQVSTDQMERAIIKTILVGGFYGLFLQQFEDYIPKHFLPIYASEIQSGTQIALHKACVSNKTVPLAVMVDGIVTEVPLNLKIGSELGEWKLDGEGQALIITSGNVAIEGKRRSGEFSLDFNMLMQYAKAHPNDDGFKLEQDHIVSLPLAYSRNDWFNLGKAQHEVRSIFLTELKRLFLKRPRVLSDIVSNQYQSIPFRGEVLQCIHALERNEIYNKEVIEAEK